MDFANEKAPGRDDEALQSVAALLNQLADDVQSGPRGDFAGTEPMRCVIAAADRLVAAYNDYSAAESAGISIERDLRLAEQALKESEEKFRVLAQTAHEAIISLDGRGRIVFWNRGAEILFGLDSYETAGKSLDSLLPDNCIAHARSSMRASGMFGERDGLIECGARRRDGTAFPVEVSISEWVSHGETYLTAVIRDITIRKKTQKSLAEEKSRLEATLGSVGDGVISLDSAGRALVFNGAAEEISGWPAATALNKAGAELLCLCRPDTSEPCFDEIFRNAVSGQWVEHDRLALIARDGKRRDIALSGAPMRDAGREIIGVVFAFRDITDKRLLEDEIFRARKLESVGVLAGGIAHDFNNILTGIITNLFMAKTALRPETEPYALISEAEGAAFRAGKLTKQLLTFSKGGAPVKENASIQELVQDSAGFCLSGSNVDCELDLPSDLWTVEIDRGQIDQVLNNLIINAKQAMPHGGTIRVQARNVAISDDVSECTEAHVPLDPGTYVKISIKDQGAGIESDTIKRIYDPYFTTKENASGLGLTTVYSIVQKHNGFITAKSSPRNGATFIFYLPAIETRRNDGEQEVGAVSGPRRALIMDDDEVIRTVILRVLKSAGFEVDAVSNGHEAIEAYRRALDEGRRYSVAVMDLTVPGGMGGREAMKRLLAIDSRARVIVSSGYANDPIMSNYREHGFVSVLRKPFNVNEFLRTVVEVMGDQGK